MFPKTKSEDDVMIKNNWVMEQTFLEIKKSTDVEEILVLMDKNDVDKVKRK